MPKLFISYRREDSAYPAHSICERLKSHFGTDSVFIDVDTIPFGVDFRKHLSAAVGKCDVLLAVIGSKWLDARQEDGTRRLDDPRDFVRIEIEAALARDIPVIPVLVDQVGMPKNTQLPDGLSELAFRNATQVRPGLDFNSDLDRLIRGLQKLMRLEPGQTPAPKEPSQTNEQSTVVRLCPHCHKGLRIPTPQLRKGGQSKFACPRCHMSLRLFHDDVRIEAVSQTDHPQNAVEEDSWKQVRGEVFRADSQPSSADWDRLAADLGCDPGSEGRPSSERPAKEQSKRPPAEQAKVIITNSIGMKLKLIPAGEFLMGSPKSDQDADVDERPQRSVKIAKSFYLGVYPVTQEEYKRLPGMKVEDDEECGRCPVKVEHWLDAVRFCNRLSEQEGLRPFYKTENGMVSGTGGAGYRLPTEVEWEYACRAGTTTRWSCGYDESLMHEFAWYAENSEDRTHPVGELKPNPWGLYDMHGNINEWCWDVYEEDRYLRSAAIDYKRQIGALEYNVFRGGSYCDGASGLRSAYRGGKPLVIDWSDQGIRVARNLD